MSGWSVLYTRGPAKTLAQVFQRTARADERISGRARQGRTVPAANRSGLVRMIERRYVKTRLIGVHEVRYVITHRGHKRLPMRWKQSAVRERREAIAQMLG
jgi:hypothetical protein